MIKMRVLLIGNFAPPYEEESLNNFTLLKMLREEKHDCLVLNTSNNPSKEEGIINTKNFVDFVLKLLRYGWKKDIMHISTKGFTRLGLLKVLMSILWGKLLLIKPVVILHSELFSIFGQIRSKVGGEQTIYLSFSLAHKIIFADKDTYNMASRFKLRDNYKLIPAFINIDENMSESEHAVLKKLQNKKKVLLFSHVMYPSILFDVLQNMLTNYLNTEIVIAVSFSEKFSAKLQHVVEEIGHNLKDNLVFIESDNIRLLSIAYAKASFILRTMSCDGEVFFEDFAFIARRPEYFGNYLYFPTSLLFIKEGDVSDLCARIFHNLLMEKGERLPEPAGDFYKRIIKIYEE